MLGTNLLTFIATKYTELNLKQDIKISSNKIFFLFGPLHWLLYTNFGAEDLRPEIRVFKGAESYYGISFVSSHQVYELRHMRILVKILTVDQFNNIEKK